MSIKSRIYLSEVVENQNAHINADKTYVVAYVETLEGDLVPVLFTDSDMQRAMKRAKKNPEDIAPAFVAPEVTPARKGWLDRLLGK